MGLFRKYWFFGGCLALGMGIAAYDELKKPENVVVKRRFFR